MKKDNILQLIGNTPLVRLNRINPNNRVKIYAKLEAYNPGGSIKDRIALAMVEAAERSGELTNEKTVIEATSGNTGIGLAMVCAVKRYRLMLVMPSSASEERKRIMRAYGAELYLTPGRLGTDGAIEEAYRLAREEPDKFVLMDQYNNPANIEAHFQRTAKEIWEQTQEQITHLVSALGTSGTAMGLSKGLKEFNPDLQIVAVEPYIGHKIQGLKNMQASYPPGIYQKKLLDRVIRIEDELAFSLCREMAKQEGLLAGMSSGAALAGALQVAENLDQGYIVVIFPDGGERYLSTSLFIAPAEQGLALYNIKNKKKVYLDIEKPNISLFTPGPPPDAPAEIDVWRRLLFTDIFVRYLKKKEMDCQALVGVADWDDQALTMARSQNITRESFSEQFLEELRSLAQKLGAQEIEFYPASSRIERMVSACQRLLSKGRAYEKLRSVYYDVFRDSDYGLLSGAVPEKLNLGKTVDMDSYVKDNPQDFTLLKRANLIDLKAGDFIKTEWGNVRPSWYLQMAATVGEIDNLKVVLVGRDHQFPHLDNLRAIWFGAFQGEPDIWMVVQNVGENGNEITNQNIYSLLNKVKSSFVLRMWLLSISYKKPLIYSEKNLRMWEHNWQRVQNLVANLQVTPQFDGQISKEVEQANFDLKSGFTETMEDNIKLYKFWPILFDFGKKMNKRFVQGNLNATEAREVLKKIKEIDAILRIVDWDKLPLPFSQWPNKILELIEQRNQAKREKNFQLADKIRQDIFQAGYILEDTPYGNRLYEN